MTRIILGFAVVVPISVVVDPDVPSDVTEDVLDVDVLDVDPPVSGHSSCPLRHVPHPSLTSSHVVRRTQ